MLSRFRLQRVILCTILIGVVFGVVLGVHQNRAAIVLYAWHAHRLFPDSAFSLNPSAALAADIGNYYFNWYGTGDVYNIDRAEMYYMTAARLNTAEPWAWFQLGRIDFLRGNSMAALRDLERHFAIHGDALPNAHYVRAVVNAYAGNHAAAEEDFFIYLKTDSDGWYTYNDLAWIYFEQGRFEWAAAAAHYGLGNNPDNTWLLLAYGVALMNMGHLDLARENMLSARDAAEKLVDEDWLRAYPGNDPREASAGIENIRATIERNIDIVDKKISAGG